MLDPDIPKIQLFTDLEQTVKSLKTDDLDQERIILLETLINYIQKNLQKSETVHLNFICTHNSRRSQFAQIWAQTAADYFSIPVRSYSGGVEVTEFNKRAVESLIRFGFNITSSENNNPIYSIHHSAGTSPILCFSKLYDATVNQTNRFAAIMTCSHAEVNCPFIPGADSRISLLYEDPKVYDDTPQESDQYDARSRQIATEMFYVFSQIKTN